MGQSFRRKKRMSMHRVEFDYYLPEGGYMEIDLDPNLDQEEKESKAILEIKDSFPDAFDVEITEIEEI
jgi:hypothetical protein